MNNNSNSADWTDDGDFDEEEDRDSDTGSDTSSDGSSESTSNSSPNEDSTDEQSNHRDGGRGDPAGTVDEAEHPDDDDIAEIAIEGDFDQLIHNIRQSGDGASTGILTKMWNYNIEEKEDEFRDDLRAASGVGRTRRKRGRRSGPVLSQQVRALIGEGNQAYVDNDIPETIRIMQEVIRIEPRAASAWSVLAQCCDDLNEKSKALQLRVMAAHLHHDPEEWERLAKQSLQLGSNQQALYCYGKIYSLDPTNVNALWDRATLAKEIGELKIARSTLLAMLKRLPHNLTVLDELRPILIELSDLALCANLFADAFAHYQDTFPTGIGYDPDADCDVPGGGFELIQILILADLQNTLAQYEKAIHTIRRGCRWLQGRAHQKFWDVCEDDREYDVVEGGRNAVGEVQPGMYPLDVNARHRLAVARIKLGDIDEGRIHANIVLSQDITEYAPLFGEVADAYYERGLYAEAGHIYEMLGGDAGTSSLYVLLQAASCRRMMGDLREAAEVYEHVIAADPMHNEAKMKLAEIHEILNEPRKALDLVLQVMDSRKRRLRSDAAEDPAVEANTSSLFEERARAKGKVSSKNPNKLSAVELRELEAQKEREVAQGFHRIRELWPHVIAGGADAEREWSVEAEKLVETFRETRALFLTSRHQGFRGMFPRSSRKQTMEASEESMASRLQLELGRDTISRKAKSDGKSSSTVDTFRTVTFDEWLRLFMHYAFLLTRRDQYDLAQEILRHITYSNAYQGRAYQDTIKLALITCAAHAGQYPTVVEQSRKLINAYQFNNEPLRILVSSLGSGLRMTDAFLVSTLSKHLLRELRLSDAGLNNQEALRWNPILRRYAIVGTSTAKGEADDVEDEDVPDDGSSPATEKSRLPTKGNPVSIALYGQICLAAKSYQSALFYLLHAYEYCPQDSMICLCAAIASFGRAMQRQADNRHHLITQGVAFLSQYRAIRGSNADDLDEVEFNFGRAFQQLGLHSLAVRHYERVLQMAERKLNVYNSDFGLAREAAYNLSLIFVTTGATPLAEDLYRRWLSL
ncbi:TPR-like protein [Wolfiporia cocos MD-104 SS10]|uniref:TPR-like protein n=1 Tax=Wolfiporia cocos (strain MD-104) TaxID=742152 RepID=A0A2H3JV91_WOLCO|nr:TPR-like protein [Wolfiporia cocos MD-104 SS10]